MTTDPDHMAKVLALLAKAESTEFPDEAEAFFAKAQELMARHAIDEAMLASAGTRGAGEVGTSTFDIEAPYASAKAALLGGIAGVNGAKAVRLPTHGSATRVLVYGFAGDREHVAQLFTSLLLHATRAMLDEPVPPGDTPRRFRHAFLVAYAARIHRRLQAARQSAVDEYEHDTGCSSAVVLADRRQLVDDALRDDHPNTRASRSSVSSRAGVTRGTVAADRADLGQARVGTTGRGALDR